MVELGKAKLQQYNELLTTLNTYLSAVKDKTTKNKKELIKSISSLEEHITTFLEQTKTVIVFKKARPTLNALLKTLSGLKNGFNSNHFNAYSEYSNSVHTNVLPKYRWLLDYTKNFAELEEQEEEPSAPVRLKKLPFQEGLREFKESQDEKPEEVRILPVKKETEEFLDKIQKYKSKLPFSLGGKAFKLVYLPVVPLFDSPILNSESHARKAGIEVKSLDTGHELSNVRGGVSSRVSRRDNIVIFLKQALLAFDGNSELGGGKQDNKQSRIKRIRVLKEKIAVAEEQLAKRKTAKEKALQEQVIEDLKAKIEAIHEEKDNSARISGTENLLRVQDFILEFLDSLNKQSPVKYSLVSNHFALNQNNSSIRFAWIMPTKQLKAYTQGIPSTKGTWNFPWHTDNPNVL